MYSPEAPELGWKVVLAKPVISERYLPRLSISSMYPSIWSAGAKGWIDVNSGHERGSIDAAELSFIVQLPSGIMEWVSEMSFRSSCLM